MVMILKLELNIYVYAHSRGLVLYNSLQLNQLREDV